MNKDIAEKRNKSPKKDKSKSSFDIFAASDKKDSGGSDGAAGDDDDGDAFGFAGMFEQSGTEEPTQAEEPPYSLPV